jgi:hypothetical protein
MKDNVMAGPACAAAALPVSTKMPAPIMAPMPSATKLSADKERVSGTPLCEVSLWTSGSSASASKTESGLRTQIFAITFPH